MNTSVSTKFAALALALFANSVLMGSVAYLFDMHQLLNMPVVAATTWVDGRVVA